MRTTSLPALVKCATFRPFESLDPGAGGARAVHLTAHQLIGQNLGAIDMFAYGPPHVPAGGDPAWLRPDGRKL